MIPFDLLNQLKMNYTTNAAGTQHTYELNHSGMQCSYCHHFAAKQFLDFWSGCWKAGSPNCIMENLCCCQFVRILCYFGSALGIGN
uniref:Uncharacterized protein n=1 Tax=Rhizophora mucronata TaxID=61149 RepID=A0A2P2PKT1_RHIMU